MKITVLAIGKARDAEAAWSAEYLKRLKGSVILKELAAPKNLPPAETQKIEADRLLENVPAKAYLVVLDERGRDLTSRDFSAHLTAWRERGVPEIIFVIGGADGVTEAVRARADFVLGFGKLTWPHRLVRVMLLEQLYRCQQISAGHPYHRD
ncbi:MAG: 23S rRNA (pseudouridine(1915)-N(3))-methyltransferase RlmH [Pseudomonadota bacterium]|nr:23S rRNA (pseudouridine(1915)-N(3))-methyltransferase RlmH [Pseudomonadota bacterium]